MTFGNPAVPVFLVDLPALYAHGLRHALAEVGLRQVAVSTLTGLPGEVPENARCVLVAPEFRVESQEPAWRPYLDGDRCAVVELVDALTTASFVRSVRRGASGVVPMDGEPHLIVDVIRAAAQGQFLLPEAGRQVLVRVDARGDAPALKAGEAEWLRRLGRGSTVAALAQAAAYSEREMYRVLSQIYRKLGAENRTQALLKAQRWGLLDELDS